MPQNKTHDRQDHGRIRDGVDAASRAYDRGLGQASDAARRAAQGIEANPLGILVGGLAVGALAGALIPRSAREKELLAPLGQRLGTSARTALAAARDAGRNELEGAGLTKDGLRGQARGLLDTVSKAAQSAGSAAAKATTDRAG